MKTIGLSVTLCCAIGCGALAADAGPTVLLDDFEVAPQTWKYVGGEEFPGAKGSAARDSSTAHDGKASYRLQADFSGGGAYVGVWRDLATLAVRDLTEIRLWIKATNVTRLGVRINDATGQCHQKKSVPLAPTRQWQELVFKIADLVGGEHWGGTNDGQWHGPPTGFGLNVGSDSVGEGKQGKLWLDDVRATVVPGGQPTLLPCLLSQTACRPAYGIGVKYRWAAEPMAGDYQVFVHVRNSAGKIVMQDDHAPPVPTSRWSGGVEYENTVMVPPELPLGEYQIVAGLWNPKGSAKLPVKPGAGVSSAGEDAWQVGVLKVTADAPLPQLGPPTLNLTGYRLTFDEDFNEPTLSVSAWGPGTRWIAHTPYAGDFGDARFADPTAGFPFTLQKGVLQIEARKTEGKWRSGLLASVDPKGQGFAQQYGYFEMRAKFPPGPGVWPAFWLLGVPKLKDKSVTQIEIDVVEQYGAHPNALHTTLHLWGPGQQHTADAKQFVVPGMTDDFHRYGVMVEAEDITFYFDGVELRRCKTPAPARVPLYLLVNLALGSGWPIDKTPTPSFLQVDYVRAYAKE
jgi:hypothetical protein